MRVTPIMLWLDLFCLQVFASCFVLFCFLKCTLVTLGVHIERTCMELLIGLTIKADWRETMKKNALHNDSSGRKDTNYLDYVDFSSLSIYNISLLFDAVHDSYWRELDCLIISLLRWRENMNIGKFKPKYEYWEA